ncbi:MAG: hypothetical protein JO244_07835 [Solirubrobacterales bacterium]|nr:hypothetical protein [Solirubrobacterales bacterium]
MSARLEDGRLRVVERTCPNLLAEAGLYRYGEDRTDRMAEARWTSTTTPWRPCATW